jgi:hypothetical protein
VLFAKQESISMKYPANQNQYGKPDKNQLVGFAQFSTSKKYQTQRHVFSKVTVSPDGLLICISK